MKIIAFALRRSGSTAFWNMFAGNDQILALDEPCNPLLKQLPKPHHKETFGPFIKLYQQDPHQFRRVFAPIPKCEELTEDFSEANARYFRFLVDGRKHWFMDVTRCHLKVQRLAAVFDDAQAIHLFRSPTGFASSHLIPSYGGWRARRDRVLGRHFFWSRRTGFNMWSIERIYNNWFPLVRKYFADLGIPEAAASVERSHEKLLLYWLFHFRFMERYGKLGFGERFTSLCFDDLCQDPKKAVGELTERLVDVPGQLATSHLKLTSRGYETNNPRWVTAMRTVGFTEAEINRWIC